MFSTAFRSTVVLLALTTGCNNAHNGIDGDADGMAETELGFDDDVAGSMVDGELVITGFAANASDVTLDGADVDADDGDFSERTTPAAGIHTYELRGEGVDGPVVARTSVLAGTFADAKAPLRNAISVQLGHDGFGRVLEGAALSMDDDALADGLLDLVDERLQQTSWLGDAEFDITNVDFDEVLIEAAPVDGRLDITMTLRGLDIDMPMTVDSGWMNWTLNSGAEAAWVTLTGSIELSVDGQHRPSVAIHGVQVEMSPLSIDAGGLPFGFDSAEIGGALEDALNDVLPSIATDLMADAVADSLKRVDADFDVPLARLRVDSNLTGLGINAHGVTMNWDARVIGGPISGDNEFLSTGVAAPTPTATDDVAMTVSDDLLNLLVFRSWRNGAVEDAGLPPVLLAKGNKLQAQLGELAVDEDTWAAGTARVNVVTDGDSLGLRMGQANLVASGRVARPDVPDDTDYSNAAFDAGMVIDNLMVPLPQGLLVDEHNVSIRRLNGKAWTELRYNVVEDEE